MEQRKRREEMGRELQMGVFRLVNTITGRMLLGHSLNLQSHFNRMRTELRLTVYRHKALQEDWIRYGEGAFFFDIVEEYLPLENEDFSAIVLKLRHLEEEWAQKLSGKPQYTRVI